MCFCILIHAHLQISTSEKQDYVHLASSVCLCGCSNCQGVKSFSGFGLVAGLVFIRWSVCRNDKQPLLLHISTDVAAQLPSNHTHGQIQQLRYCNGPALGLEIARFFHTEICNCVTIQYQNNCLSESLHFGNTSLSFKPFVLHLYRKQDKHIHLEIKSRHEEYCQRQYFTLALNDKQSCCRCAVCILLILH